MFKYITIFKMWICKRVNKILARSHLYTSFLFDTTHLSYNPPWNRDGKVSPMLPMKTKQIPLGFCLQSGRSLAKANNCIFQTEFFRKRENVLDRLTFTWLRSTQGFSIFSTKFHVLILPFNLLKCADKSIYLHLYEPLSFMSSLYITKLS